MVPGAFSGLGFRVCAQVILNYFRVGWRVLDSRACYFLLLGLQQVWRLISKPQTPNPKPRGSTVLLV